MVRRRSGKSKAAHSKSRGVDRKDSKIKRWNKASDIPLEEEDQFHASRDKILLEGDEYGDDEDGDEDEVFALKGISEDGSSEEDEDDDEVQGGEDEDDDIDEVHYAAAAAEKKKKKSKGKKGHGDEKNDSEEEEEAESEEEEEVWGAKKSAYYASNAEQIESDDEEANELEEQEARRLQAKARDAMDDDDFGLGDITEGLLEADGFVDEPPQSIVQQLPQDKQSLLRHLEKTNPEALALAHDWEDIAFSLVKSKAKIERIQTEDPASFGLSMMHLHHQALLTYATTLAFYLHLRSTEKYVQRPDLLRAHPILSRLLTLKQSLQTLEDLDFAASDDSDLSDSDLDDDEDEDEEDDEAAVDWTADAQNLWTGNNSLKTKGKGLDQGELEALLREANELMDVDGLPSSSSPPASGSQSRASRPKGKRKAKANADEDEAREPTLPAEPPKKKRKANTKNAAPVVFDLVEPELAPPKSKSKSKADSKADSKTNPKEKGKGKGKSTGTAHADDVYGEVAALDVADTADKQARKKSLRFHVARIESTAVRRAGARQGALGGDDDIPYRERKKERDARLAKEVARSREAAQGDDLDDVDPEREAGLDASKKEGGKGKGKKRGREEEEEGDEDGGGEDGYYDLVRRKSKEKKERKKQEYEVASAAARHFDEETVDGPRSLTRAILKNKGLTPKRSKSVRNPRVKKREKYEKAKKKVSSQKAVYKGGMDASRYSGERTGISQTIKGVRL